MSEFKSITVAELKALLEDQSPNLLVTFASNYGDYHRTQQVHSLDGYAEEMKIVETAYSDSGFALSDEDDDVDRPDDGEFVLVIS